MPLNRSRAVVLVALACVLALVGCDNASETPAEAQTATRPKPSPSTPKVAQLSADMVAAVSGGKSADWIGVHFALGAVPTVGKPLPVKIAIVPHQPFSSLSAHFEPRDGLQMTAGESFGPVNDPKPETPLEHALMVVPTQEGVFMISVGVDTQGEEGNFIRIYTIPVIVGMNSAAPAPAAK
jgi:uncharacterized lipoprotein NlpE involved in copper resistance